jgi:protein SCO1
MQRRHSWLVYLISALALGILFAIVYIVYLLMTTPEPDVITLTPDDQYNAITAIEPPVAMPDFTLTNQHGEPISLSDLSGKPVLMTYGFTHCPDVCPITLGEMRNIHEVIGGNINYVFVSVDGERDTPEVLRDYFELVRVNDFLLGMTGTPDAVREVGTPYGVDFIYGMPDENGNYDVTHTAGMFLLDANRNWMRRYTYGMDTNLIIENIQKTID